MIKRPARPGLSRDSSRGLGVHFSLIDSRFLSWTVFAGGGLARQAALGVTSDNNDFIFPMGVLKKLYSLKLLQFFLEKFFLIHQMTNVNQPHSPKLFTSRRWIQQFCVSYWTFKRQILSGRVTEIKVLLKCMYMT